MRMRMKKLRIDSKTLHFKVIMEHYDGYTNYKTNFFNKNGKKAEIKWSWKKLRKVETGEMIDNYDYLFTIHKDITSERYGKSDIRKWLEEKLEVINRKEEIKRGEYV